MNTKPIKTGLLVCGAAVLAVVHAQAVDSNTKLDRAVGLLNNNQPKEARAVLASVSKDDPAYATAKGYDALCLYQVDKRKFLDSLESGKIQSADIASDLREDLDYKQIDALLFYRKFEQLLPKIAEFSQQHGNSPRMEAVREYQMATLYERGMKNLGDAAFTKNGKTSKDAEGTTQRLRVAQDNLAQFLKLAADREQDRYQTLIDRDLATEVVEAMSALGGEDEALKLVPLAERENMTLTLVQLHKKIDTDADANLRRMTNFLNRFPNSKYCKRVQYDMGDVALEEGWRLNYVAFKRTNAAPYFKMAHGLFSGLITEEPAGISEADMQESRVGLLRIYYAQGDWAKLSTWATQMLTNAAPGGKDWVAIKLYDAAGLACQSKLTEAATELDELLAIGFKNHPSYDGLLISAAEWRIRVAKKAGDEAVISRVFEMVQNSDCYGSLKRTFEKQFGTLLAEPNLISK